MGDVCAFAHCYADCIQKRNQREVALMQKLFYVFTITVALFGCGGGGSGSDNSASGATPAAPAIDATADSSVATVSVVVNVAQQ